MHDQVLQISEPGTFASKVELAKACRKCCAEDTCASHTHTGKDRKGISLTVCEGVELIIGPIEGSANKGKRTLHDPKSVPCPDCTKVLKHQA